MPGPRSPSRSHPLRGAFVPLILFLHRNACSPPSRPAPATCQRRVVPGAAVTGSSPPTSIALRSAPSPCRGAARRVDRALGESTIPGSFSVSAGGQANYRFPLVVPPGRLGMEPQLAVAYDSLRRAPAGDARRGLLAARAVGRSRAVRPTSHKTASSRRSSTTTAITSAWTACASCRVPTSAVTAAAGTVEYRARSPTPSPRSWMHPRRRAPAPWSFEVFTKAGHVLEYGAASEQPGHGDRRAPSPPGEAHDGAGPARQRRRLHLRERRRPR